MKRWGNLAGSFALWRSCSICPKKKLKEMKVLMHCPGLCSSSTHVQQLFLPSDSLQNSSALPCSKAQPTATFWEGLYLHLQLFRGPVPAWKSKSPHLQIQPVIPSSLHVSVTPKGGSCVFSSLHSFPCSLPLIVQKHFHGFNENQHFQKKK